MSYSGLNRAELLAAKKRIAIFGAGPNFKTLCNTYMSSISILENTVCIIDNDAEKHTENFYIHSYVLPCVSFDEFVRRFYTKDIVILLAARNNSEIISQIECYEDEKIDWDFLRLVLNDPEPYILPPIPAESTPLIPKIIHYCWFGGNPLPDSLQKCIDSWSVYCPDYEIVRHDETNYDVNKNIYVKKAYDQKIWSDITDFARVDIIYNNGGFYLDTDVELIKSLDDFRHNKLFYGFEFTGRLNSGLGFGGIKGFESLREQMDFFCCSNIIKANAVFQMDFNSEQMMKRGFLMNNTYQTIGGVTLYPSDVFAPKMWPSPWHCTHITPNTHSIHYNSATHFEPRKKLIEESKKKVV
jgi:hypothetical protein